MRVGGPPRPTPGERHTLGARNARDGNSGAGGSAALAAQLARADLGLLLTTTEDLPTWIPLGLLAEEDRVQIELGPGTWPVVLAPRPGASSSRATAPGTNLAVVEVRAGELISWDWTGSSALGCPAWSPR